MVYQAKRAGFLSHGGSPTKPWVSEKKWSSMTWMIWGYPHDLGNLQIVSRSPLWLNLVSGFNTPVSWSLGDCRPIYIYIYIHTHMLENKKYGWNRQPYSFLMVNSTHIKPPLLVFTDYCSVYHLFRYLCWANTGWLVGISIGDKTLL